MNIQKLEYLVEVAKTGSFSIASQNLFVSQSAISQSIISIEKKLGIKLFERSRGGNNAIPTIDGKQIIPIANEIVLKYQELIHKAQLINNNMTGNLKISTVPGFIEQLLSPISTIKEEYPNITIDIFQKPGQEIIEDVLEGRSDIGIVPFIKHLLENNEHLIYHKLFEGKMKLLVSKKSSLAKKSFVTPQQIVKETLLSYNGEYMRWFKHNFYKKFGVMKELFNSTNIDALWKATDDNLGVLFVPWFPDVNYNIGENLKLLDIKDYEEIQIQYVWIMSSKKHYSTMIEDYITILKEELNAK
ncbi:LysR family transcriptional regulator [Bacillus sp. EAC]|uniref:LysR substrate-binding domain-containing protein n=1 Tax=Bacillus sp. EAC TaxID=1978338 RepID=UPI001C4E7C9B|nr:LysR family transcriptional regulator [Bacillus sp. EAC]